MNITDYLQNFHPIVQALFGTGFTWSMTALGAAMIFIGKELKP